MLARIRKSVEEKDAGFTLVELLVVMIIIGILAAIAVPVFMNQRKKGVDTSIKSDLRAAAQAVETSYVDAANYPTGTAGSYVDVTGLTSYVSSGTGTNLGIKLSTGNVVAYKKTTTGGFCIQGSNPNGNAVGAAASGGTYYWYVSESGGLQQTATAAAPTGTCA